MPSSLLESSIIMNSIFPIRHNYLYFSLGFLLPITLCCYFIWKSLLIFLSFCAYFCVSGKSTTSLVLEGNSLMKKRSSSAVPPCGHVVSCSPGPGVSGSVSNVCCVCSAVVFWLFYPLGQSSAASLCLFSAVFGSWSECGVF